jgi:hypothetical protein
MNKKVFLPYKPKTNSNHYRNSGIFLKNVTFILVEKFWKIRTKYKHLENKNLWNEKMIKLINQTFTNTNDITSNL